MNERHEYMLYHSSLSVSELPSFSSRRLSPKAMRAPRDARAEEAEPPRMELLPSPPRAPPPTIYLRSAIFSFLFDVLLIRPRISWAPTIPLITERSDKTDFPL